MNNTIRNSMIDDIENEYKRIDSNWMWLHYYTFVGLVLFGLLVECALTSLWYLGGYIEIPLKRYTFKYIVVPFIGNMALIISSTLVMFSKNMPQRAKVYILSALFVGGCFIFFTVHSIFGSLYLIFTLPVLLTVVYGDYILTSATALLGIAAKVISELFITWDSDKIPPLSSFLKCTDFLISVCVLFSFYGACISVIRFERQKNDASIVKEIERQQMRRKLITDELTQVCNRTGLRRAFEKMEQDVLHNSYTFAMIDLDNFKELNDTMGHDKGDQCLREFGRIMTEKSVDGIPFRFGGDEFCILFQNVQSQKVVDTCKSIQAALQKSWTMPHELALTASIGIAQYREGMTAQQLLQNTDAALYHSKKTRNTICIYEEMEAQENV